MKVIVIGASGAVGKCAVDALSARHEVIKVGRSSGDIKVDLEDVESIRAMYREAGKIDAGHYVNYIFEAEGDAIARMDARLKLNNKVYLQHFQRLD